MTTPIRIAVSAGDPAGIGPDIVLAAAQRAWPAELVVIADRAMLAERAARLGLSVRLVDYPDPPAGAGHAGHHGAGGTERSQSGASSTPVEPVLRVLHVPLAAPATPGEGNPLNAGATLAALRRAVAGCQRGEFAAMVTAPVNKAIIADSGVPFSGHTEYLAELTGASRVVMLLTATDLRVALATTHIPLAQVPDAIRATPLVELLQVLNRDLRDKFRIAAPRISVLGLNPHAGEGGHLGSEDRDIIAPAIAAARAAGISASGPWPADTAFNAALRQQTDAYLAMYHDQGLPVLKYASFGAAVNVTLGLPIIRTSVDHGTAYDLAGSGKADASSLFAALDLAIELGQRAAMPG